MGTHQGAAEPWAYGDGVLTLLDQRRLPHEVTFVACPGARETAEAIRSLAVRGAPLIGVAAAFGLAAEGRRLLRSSIPESGGPGDGGGLRGALESAARLLESARPTAVNLAAAIERMRRALRRGVDLPDAELVAALEREAAALAEEDRLACRAIGEHGARYLGGRLAEGPATILTHCNAGALATAGIGTALGVIRVLAETRKVTVLADETRPFFQGARLTAWELARDGFDVTLLPDVAAAWVIASARVGAVVVGADRIAANGDVANKVGTYGLALACRAHGVPFVVAAPTTTLDLACPAGDRIPIEWRDASEVLTITGAGGAAVHVAPEGVPALYPAFDVTPASLVDAIVTEHGVSTPPHGEGLPRLARTAPNATP